MPSGAAVIKYEGARGITWKIKYRDADGRQVKETLGRAADGWTRRKAEAELRARLVAVERDGYRKPTPITFEDFARSWLDQVAAAREHRDTTRHDYRGVVENHFVPYFKGMALAEISTAEVQDYVVAKRQAKESLGPRTLNLHISRLHSIFDQARRQRLVQTNPVKDVERPRVPKSRWTILSAVEIAAVMRAFEELIGEAGNEVERAWRQTAKAMAVTMQYAWLRRGELLGLSWGDIELHHPHGPRLHVRQTWVRGRGGKPKTDDGRRTIALAPQLAEELWQHRRRSDFKGEDERVFCHPLRGSAIASGYFGEIMKPVLLRAGVERTMREYHDWRHTGITNAAAAGMSPLAIMRMAGHSNFSTTQRYIDLAGVIFGDEVRLLGDWYTGTKNGYQINPDVRPTRIGSGIEALAD
jgi:integrase